MLGFSSKFQVVKFRFITSTYSGDRSFWDRTERFWNDFISIKSGISFLLWPYYHCIRLNGISITSDDANHRQFPLISVFKQQETANISVTFIIKILKGRGKGGNETTCLTPKYKYIFENKRLDAQIHLQVWEK